ncbi:PspC domain-containing protein [Cellulomonas sp. APG4]|uniref:PspC domain-containing protein n=1 Tax=Cellulomonas sp. APG4 TaxID=1538656 RepID=UPI00137A0266|nr:PspC domain-containing protein [Cellulomonas sp. APG4]NCT89599.1 PspC domain-containing protein [Cellulomonas sp. APG4]
MSTSTPPPGGPTDPAGPTTAGPQAPRSTGVDGFFDGVRRTGLVRSDERWIGGVAGGLAQRLNIDPLVTRGLLAVSVLLGGLGLVLYGIGWALLPEQRDGRIHLQQLFRGDFDIAVLGAFLVTAAGLSTPGRLAPGGWWWGGDGGGWSTLLWIAAIAVVVVVAVTASRDRGGAGPTTALPPTAPPPPPGGATPVTPADADPNRGPQMTQPAPPPPGPAAGTSAAAATGPTARTSVGGGPTTALPPRPGAYTSYGPPAPGQPGGYGPPPPRGPVPPPVALPRRRPSGPGATTTGVVTALTLLALAVLMYLEREGSFDGPVLLTAGAVGIVLAGLAVVVSGLRGRTSGALGWLAVVGVLIVGPGLAIADHEWGWYGSSTGVGDLDHTPTTVAQAERGYSIGAGEARVDLTEIPLDDTPVEVPISVGAGDVTVLVPEGSDYAADVRIFAGEIRWLDDSFSRAGAGDTLELESPAVERGAEPEIVLDISVGAGTVTVEER